MIETKSFFVIGSGRSATTAVAQILDTAINATVTIEAAPKLLRESRALLEGRLENPLEVLHRARGDAIREAHTKGLIYGDKNLAYMPFIPYLKQIEDCKIVFLYRDGRDVVRSLMDTSSLKHPFVFTRSEDGASKETANDENDWDYNRRRPLLNEPFYTEWPEMDKFEKFSWEWAYYNQSMLDHLAGFPKERWMGLDVSSANLDDYRALFEFLDLQGFDTQKIEDMTKSRINSLPTRFGISDVFPYWRNWEEVRRLRFEELAGFMMKRLGYT